MIGDRIKALSKKSSFLQGQQNQLQKSIDENNEKQNNLTIQQSRHERSLEIAKVVGLATQKQLEYHLEEQVSLAMQAVFDDPYEFVVSFQEKQGKTVAELLFARRDMEFPPRGSAGGGSIDIAAFALRIAYWSMRQDKQVRPLLILDEPFSQLKGEDANLRALAMVKELSIRLELQIIMISDERIPREQIIENADRVFYIAQNRNGISRINDNRPKKKMQRKTK